MNPCHQIKQVNLWTMAISSCEADRSSKQVPKFAMSDYQGSVL